MVKSGSLVDDAEQYEALEALDKVVSSILESKQQQQDTQGQSQAQEGKKLYKNNISNGLNEKCFIKPINGVYLYGEVGIGKRLVILRRLH